MIKFSRLQSTTNAENTLSILRNLRLRSSQIQPFKHKPHKIVKHTQTIRRLLPTNCLSVLDHFVGLALKGLKEQLFATKEPLIYNELILLLEEKLML